MANQEIYLSENNIDFLYRDVSQQILQKMNFNLNSSPKYKQTVAGMMDKVYSNSEPKLLTNLSALNKYTIQKITDYFVLQLSKKQKGSNSNNNNNNNNNNNANNYNNLMDRPMRVSQPNGSTEVDINNRLDMIKNERMILNNNNNNNNNNNQPRNPTIINTISIQDLESIKGETSKKYEQLLSSRGNNININTDNVKQQPRNNNININTSINNSNNNVQTELNILPFTIGDDFSNQSMNPGQPLYFNSDELTETTGEHIAGKFDDLQKIRNKEVQDFMSFQQTTQNNNSSNNSSNSISSSNLNDSNFNSNPNPNLNENFTNFQNQSNKISSNVLGERIQLDQENALRNPLDFNRTNIYTNSGEAEPRNANSNSLKVANTQDKVFSKDLEVGNPIYDFILNQMRNSERHYEDVPHYIVVSSEDRQWENDVENRYNFLVNFRPTSTQKGVGIDVLYRNVVSVEVIKVIFPHDRLSVPYDNRIYLDLQSYPFLVMDIDELDGVFRGSNNTINDAFALLLFDKAYDSEVLTCDQINNSLATGDTIKKRFDRQFKRGFMAFCPFLFEKKKYPNTPLASLNRLTIRFYRPDGQPISLDSDHLEINTVQYLAEDHTESIELLQTPGFPKTGTGVYIKITTVKYFSNRTFRVGDLIKIKNYKVVSTDNEEQKFQEFINRVEGHIIINLQLELTEELTAANNNHGYINTLYISPPGEINYKNGGLDTTTSFTTNPLLPVTTADGKGVLINSSMQVHITFKITTRDDKTISVIKPVNV